MKDSSIKDDFRAWVRMELSERVGEDHRKVAQLYFSGQRFDGDSHLRNMVIHHATRLACTRADPTKYRWTI